MVIKFQCFVCLLAVILPNIVWTMARNVPERIIPTQNPDAAAGGVGDAKNVVNYGGIGGYSGVGNNGLPFGVFGSGVGSLGNGIGGGFGGLTGFGPGGGMTAIGVVPGGGVP